MAILALSAALTQPVSQPADQDSPPPLAGPEVNVEKSRTLVDYAMTGRFTPVEGRPEIAGAALLELTDEESHGVREIEEARAVAIVHLLIDELDMLRAMTDAQLAGDNAEAERLLREMWLTHDKGELVTPLLDELADVLDETRAAELRELTDEYLDAWFEARGQRGESREDALLRMSLAIFQREVQQAYQASLQSTRQAMEGIYDAVEPTDAQREAIRTIVIEHLKTTRLKATPVQRRAAMRKIYDVLDAERRGKLFDYMTRVAVPD